jgi:hypothetical protein
LRSEPEAEQLQIIERASGINPPCRASPRQRAS